MIPDAWKPLMRALNAPEWTAFGTPTNRDADAPCDVYEPIEMGPDEQAHGTCETDGHYLCAEGSVVCRHISAQALEHRRDPERV